MSLHVEYRPKSLSDVIGQKPVVDSLRAFADLPIEQVPHSYLFKGPSGVGKTTLARLIATEIIGMQSTKGITEIDAASSSGVNDIRGVFGRADYIPVDSDALFIIVDECHSLSRQAWQAVLKTIEEPPDHAYFVFCTTEADKVPRTVETRCISYTLDPIGQDELIDLIEWVIEEEEMQLPKEASRMIASHSEGSPRQALTLLAQCEGAKNKAAMLDRLRSPEALPVMKDLIDCFRVPPKSPEDKARQALQILAKLQQSSPTAIRKAVLGYYTKVALGGQKPDNMLWTLNVLSGFSNTRRMPDEMTSIVLSIADVLLGGDDD